MILQVLQHRLNTTGHFVHQREHEVQLCGNTPMTEQTHFSNIKTYQNIKKCCYHDPKNMKFQYKKLLSKKAKWVKLGIADALAFPSLYIQ